MANDESLLMFIRLKYNLGRTFVHRHFTVTLQVHTEHKLLLSESSNPKLEELGISEFYHIFFARHTENMIDIDKQFNLE